MLMVILGAGASYDSFAPRPAPPPTEKLDLLNRLPLADQLFDDKRDFFAVTLGKYSPALAVANDLRIRPGNQTVEEVLEGLQEEAATDDRIHRQLTAIRYYLQDMLSECEEHWTGAVTHGATNYQSLLNRIERVRHKAADTVCLVTFNYDTLLEDAMSAVEIHIKEIRDYINNRSYKIIKLHGSTSWGREIQDTIDAAKKSDRMLVVNEVINRLPDLTITNIYHLLKQRPIHRANNLAILFPALAIPVQTKQQYECPESHYQTLKDLLPKVTKILIIGWQGAEKHFLQDLKGLLKGSPQVMVACGTMESGIDTINNMQVAGVRAEYRRPFGHGFSKLVGEKRDELDGFLIM